MQIKNLETNEVKTILNRERPPITVNTYGAPFAGVDAQGNPVFAQSPRDGGPPRILPNVFPAQRATGVPNAELTDNALNTIQELRDLAKSNPRSVTGMLSGAARTVESVKGLVAPFDQDMPANKANRLREQLVGVITSLAPRRENMSNADKARLDRLAGFAKTNNAGELLAALNDMETLVRIYGRGGRPATPGPTSSNAPSAPRSLDDIARETLR